MAILSAQIAGVHKTVLAAESAVSAAGGEFACAGHVSQPYTYLTGRRTGHRFGDDRLCAQGHLREFPRRHHLTPGHTDHHHAYLIENPVQKMLFTGDTLLIDACGRTDFQSDDAGDLYNSIHNKLFSLPDETVVYPAHD